MRAIDADALTEILTIAIRNMEGIAKFIGCEDDPEIKMEIKAYRDILNGVKEQPTIESERKKGKWIAVDSFSAYGGDEATWMAHGNPIAFYYCSECKEQAYAGEDGESLITEYCPNCGADMRGEQDDR